MTLTLSRVFFTVQFAMEMLAASLLFMKGYRRRRGWLAVLMGGAVLLLALAGATQRIKTGIISAAYPGAQNGEEFWFSCGLSFAQNLLLLTLCGAVIGGIYHTSVKSAIYLTASAFAIQNLARRVFVLSLVGLTGASAHHSGVLSTWDAGTLMTYVAVYVAVYAFAYLVFLRRANEADDTLISRKIAVAFISITALSLLFSTVFIPQEASAVTVYLFLQLAQAMLCVMTLFFQFFILDWYRMQFREAATEQLYRQQQRQYEWSREAMEAVNINAHDLKHFLNGIGRALDGNRDSVRKELTRISDSVSAWETTFHTGCEALDVVLTEKAQMCHQHEAELSVMADGSALRGMEAFDIYSLFSNALDNAIEAVGAIPEPENRMILLNVCVRNGLTVIAVENTYAEKPVIRDGKLITRKPDKRFHGFGTRSMAKTVEKYGGTVSFSVDDSLFHLNIAIALQNRQ